LKAVLIIAKLIKKNILEYVLLKDINDTDSCAQQLVKLMSKFPSKLNLIEFNAWPGVGYEPSDSETVQKFYEKIKKYWTHSNIEKI